MRLGSVSRGVAATIVAFGFVACSGAGGGGDGGGSTYRISGTVSGTTGVTLTLSGAASATATTNASGAYTFTGLSNGSYTITPAKTGFTFDPASVAVTVSGADVAGKDFVATAVSSATHAIGGTVTGPWVEGVPIALSGASSATTTTDASGHYRFPNLPAGAYTVTPALAGWSYAPASANAVVSTADVARNFEASSTVPSFGISGTIAYGGAKTGRIYVRADGSDGTRHGTTVAGPGPFTIRGLTAGSYFVRAFRDSVGEGTDNETNPYALGIAVSVGASNVTGITLALSDPAPFSPATPAGLVAIPGNGSALVFWDTVWGERGEAATAYELSWGTDAAASNGGTVTVKARGDAHYLQTGLDDGTAYYWKIASVAGAARSAASAPIGPIPIGAGSGANTVSGSVSFPGAATGSLFVALRDTGTGMFYVKRVAATASPAAYAVSGVPSGSYVLYAILDQDADGVIDAGDLSNVNADSAPFPVTGDTQRDVELSAANAIAHVETNHWRQGTFEGYHVAVWIEAHVKAPVAVTIVSGQGLPLPLDLGKDWDFSSWLGLGADRPAVGATYRFRVTYADGTSETLAESVTGVLDAFARDLVTVTDAPHSRAVPQFTWSDPASPPAAFTYSLSLWGPDAEWYFPQDGSLPSTVHSAIYDEDSGATAAALTAGQVYSWKVTVRDANGNTAQQEATYLP